MFRNVENIMGISDIIALIALLISIASFIYTTRKEYLSNIFYQADSISTWLTEEYSNSHRDCNSNPMVIVIICDKSTQPVYDVVLSHGVQQYDYPTSPNRNPVSIDLRCINTTVVGVLPPGKYRSYIISPNHGMHKRFQSTIAFKDTRGNSWIRNATGKLIRIPRGTDTFTAMACPLPPPYLVPIEPIE